MKTCFIIGPPAEDPESEKRTEWIHKAVSNALAELDYKTEHVNKLPMPGVKMQEITRHLAEDAIVIADLAIADPNVYYEMAFRHAVGKPMIYLGATGQVLPAAFGDLSLIRIEPSDPWQAMKMITKSAKAIEEPGYQWTTPLAEVLTRAVFSKRAEKEEKNVAKFFDSLSEKINLQFAELQNLTRQLEDSMRKPLHGIDEVFLQLYSMLRNVKKGGRLWFVGMTLGLGPPHKYRMSKWPATSRRVQQSEGAPAGDENPATCNIDELFKAKWKGKEPPPSFDEMIRELHKSLGLIVEEAQDPFVVCLTNDKNILRDKFLAKLALRSSYSTLAPDMDRVLSEIMNLHQELAKKTPANRPIKYVDSIPLQILVVERGDISPMAVGKKACVVFHVGTGNIETHVLEDGETGFYTEVDSVVEMFETMAESLWEAGTIDPGPLSIPDQPPDSN